MKKYDNKAGIIVITSNLKSKELMSFKEKFNSKALMRDTFVDFLEKHLNGKEGSDNKNSEFYLKIQTTKYYDYSYRHSNGDLYIIFNREE